MGTGVMIGAGIFALTGQVAEFSGTLFPAAFLLAAVISGFSAYTYIKVSNKYPSAGGIAMIVGPMLLLYVFSFADRAVLFYGLFFAGFGVVAKGVSDLKDAEAALRRFDLDKHG